jgi:hypothetical protein
MATAIDISGVSEDATNLRDMLEGVLERVESVFQSHNVNLPSRRYWALGDQPAIDCEQVVVTLLQLYLGPPGAQVNQPQRCNQPRTATLAVSISREVPVVGQNGRAPSAEKLSLSASYAAIDAWVLMQSVNLFDMWDDTGYGLGVIATLETSQPEGGFQTVVLQITMAVP